MNTKECPSCAMEINSDDKVCPVCNYEFPEPSSSAKYVGIFLLILFIGLVIFGLF